MISQDMIERIKQLAMEWVCPLTQQPQTPYEKSHIKELTGFGIATVEVLFPEAAGLVPDGGSDEVGD